MKTMSYARRGNTNTSAPASASARAWQVTLALTLTLAACGGPPPAPTPDNPQPAVPNLAGLDVMVLPAQPAPGGVPAGFVEALSALLTTEYPSVTWILPAAIDRVIERTPTLGIRPHALSVSILRAPETERIGDPLYGDLRRLGAIVDARYAVVVYQAGYVAAPDSIGGHGRIEGAAAIIDTIGGRILWRGLFAGERGPAGDEVALATAVQRLARLIAPAQ